MKKRLIIALMAVSLVFPQMAFAEDSTEITESSSVVEAVQDSLNTEDADTYTLSSAQELVEFAQMSRDSSAAFKGKTIVLDADIDLSGIDWQPIRLSGATFDGQNHTITGLTISGRSEAGFIGAATDVNIRNIKFSGCKIDGGYALGVVAGRITGGSIENCSVSGSSITGNSINIGGIVGYTQSGAEIKNCSFADGSVTGVSQVGGITGGNCVQSAYGGSITGCTVSAQIQGTGMRIGGIAGWFKSSDESGLIDSCRFSGSITNSASGMGNNAVGGIAGYLEGTVKNSFVSGSVSSSTDFIGGIAGNINRGLITSCVSEASVSCTADNTGGIVGNLKYAQIENSYSTGDISGRYYVGGIAGNMQSDSADVSNCYTAGSVNGASYVGGIVGRMQNGASVSYSFVLGDVTDTGNCGGGIAGGVSNGSISSCMVFSQSVSVGNGYAGRIAGYVGTGAFSECYVSNGIQFVGGEITKEGADTQNGQAVSAAEAAMDSTLFSADVWTLRSGYYPKLASLDKEGLPSQEREIPNAFFSLIIEKYLNDEIADMERDYKLLPDGAETGTEGISVDGRIPAGIYKLYDGDTDTGIIVDGTEGDVSVSVSYYTVAFYDGENKFGEDTPQAEQIILAGQLPQQVEAPYKEGMLFRGWKTDAALSEDFSFESAVTAPTVVYAAFEAVDKTIAVDKINIAFGTEKVGYEKPSAETVTVTNNGNVQITLSVGEVGNFEISELSAETLMPGEAASFTIAPKAGLAEGTYEELLILSVDGNEVSTIELKFKVEKTEAKDPEEDDKKPGGDDTKKPGTTTKPSITTKPGITKPSITTKPGTTVNKGKTTISKTGTGAKTGDNTEAMPLVILLGLSSAILAGGLAFSKKKNK